MNVTITVNIDVADIDVLNDIISILETTLPYMADNVVVSDDMQHKNKKEDK